MGLAQRNAEWRGRLPTGEAMITSGFNVPAEFVIHTPGPIGEDPAKLASCYLSALERCRERGIRSIAFCCISTGLFGYPNDRAAEVAVSTVREWLNAAVKASPVASDGELPQTSASSAPVD